MDVECSFWLEFVALFCLGLIGIISVLPYSAAIRKLTGHSSRRSYRLIIILQIIQGAVLLIVAIGVGLPSAHAVGLGAPMVESILRGQYFSGLISAMPVTAVISGLTTSIVILLLDRMLFVRHLPGRFGEITSKIPISYSFLASLYGGITEEILVRLFLFSFLAWLLSALYRSTSVLHAGGWWIINVIVAILFGAGHLPLMRAIIGLSAVTVTRTFLLNGTAGILFGWLYWKYGLEASMIAHFCADIFINAAELRKRWRANNTTHGTAGQHSNNSQARS
jgi:membrane protease YdiL (CAAX protease family)